VSAFYLLSYSPIILQDMLVQSVTKKDIQKKIHNAAVTTTPTESMTFVASENSASQTSVTHTRPKLQVCLPSDF
jgi:hypothetical protein